MVERVRVKDPRRDNLKPIQKGERRGGRQKGQQNKITTLLKEAITMAAEKVGSDNKGKDGLVGYLSWLSRKEPAVFGRLLEKLLPYQLTGKDGGPVQLEYKTKQELAQRMKERGLPVPPSLIHEPPTLQQ